MHTIIPENTQFSEYINANTLSLSHRRGLVLHLLYTLECHDYEYTIQDVLYFYNIDFGIIINQDDTIISIIQSIVNHRSILDEELKKYLENWPIDRISILVKLILRYGLFELKEKKNDNKLIINEAVELAKGYAEEHSYRIVNGILDAYSKQNTNLK